MIFRLEVKLMSELPEELKNMSVVTEVGMFGELNVKDPTERKIKKKKKKDENSNDVHIDDIEE